MLSKVDVTSRQGAQLTLSLEDPSNGYIVKEVEGLDPVNATLVSSSFAQMDGAQYHSSRREPRNLVLKLELDPDYNTTTHKLRKALYDFFMPKSQVHLRLRTIEGEGILDYLDTEIVGRVESFESPRFTQEPAVDISLMCFDPDFRAPDPVTFSGLSTAGLDELTLTYPGTVETGIQFVLKPNRDISAFTIYHRPPDGTLRTLDFSNPLLANDELRISTVQGAKGVTRKRASVESPLLYGVSPQSNWIELDHGENKIRVYAEGAPVPFEIEYITRYGAL